MLNFSKVREEFGRLNQDQVDGINAVLEACLEAGWCKSWTAYALATAWHETATTMKPIKEYGGPTYFTKMYDIKGSRPSLARANGNTSPGDGAKYFGRGYVQLTWKDNYRKAEKLLGIIGLVANPDLALEPHNAAKIMISGMEEGWFTGVSCKKAMPDEKASYEQFRYARRIINGTDKAQTIANYALDFQDAL